jgi:hypothetical protein
LRLSHFNTAKECWEKVSKEYKAKRTYAQNDLEDACFKMTCPKGGNVRREVLAAAGVHITDKEYQRTLLRGIPDELARFASQLLSATRLVHHASTVDTDTLIDYICEEAERLKNRRAQGQKWQEWDKKGEGLAGEVSADTRSHSGRRKHRKGKYYQYWHTCMR